jgi:hypothetical protein
MDNNYERQGQHSWDFPLLLSTVKDNICDILQPVALLGRLGLSFDGCRIFR